MPERTYLTPAEEKRFQQWVRASGITDVDQPGSFYDYRGYWKRNGSVPMRFGEDHFTDTYKQHGHPTFSIESQYSQGPWDGGRWLSDTDFVPPGADFLRTSRGQSKLDPSLLLEALQSLMQTKGVR